MSLELVLSRLHGVKPEGKGHRAYCPHHEAQQSGKPSLSINTGKSGAVLLRCWSGCSFTSVMTAMGLKAGDAFEDNERRTPPAAPKYKPGWHTIDAASTAALGYARKKIGANGRETRRDFYSDTFAVLRFDGDDDKDYRPVHRNGTGLWHLSDPEGKLPLFHADRIGPCTDVVTSRVYLVEGEKCVEAAESIGLIAITSAHGSQSAAKADWAPVKDRDIVILPDNDTSGEDYASKATSFCRAAGARSVRIVKLADLAAGGDIADWLEARECFAELDALKAEIDALADAAPECEASAAPSPFRRSLIMSSGSTIKAESTGYLWNRRIPLGITVAFSRPGRGKSTLAARLTSNVTTGEDWPDGAPCERGSAIIIKGEGSDAATKDRMDLAGAVPSRYFVISRTDDPNAAMIDLATDVPLLDEVLRPDTRLIIVDTLDSLYTSMRMIDNGNIRKCLWPLQELAENRGIAVVLLAHTNKGGYADPIDRLSGGRAIGAAARAVWYLGKLTPDADLCHFAVVKANDFQPARTLAYRIAGVDGDRPGYIDWQGESEVSAWDLDGPPKNDREDKADACEAWLKDLLADGPKPVREVERLADAEDYGRKVMAKAKSALELRTVAQKGAFPTAFWLCLLGQCPPPLSMTPKGVIFDSESETNVTPSKGHAVGAGLGGRL